MEMLGDPNPRCGSVLLMGLTGQHRGLDARGNWYGVDPRVLRRELHSKLGGSLLNRIANRLLVDGGIMGLLETEPGNWGNSIDYPIRR